MSIIYEALKKTQNSLGTKISSSLEPKKKNRSLWIISSIIFAGLTAFSIAFVWILHTNYPVTQPSAVSKKIPSAKSQKPFPSKPLANTKPVATAPEIHKDHALILNGIVSMNNDQFALINNQILKEGDYINGKRVIRITPQKVEIFDNGKIITLTTKN